MRYPRIHTTCGLLALAAAAAAARGDAVVLKTGVPFDPVEITQVANGQITFRFGTGRLLTKSLAEVRTITLADNPDFNRGELHLKNGEHDQAISAYREAEGRARRPWQGTLVSYRLLAAAEAAGQIDQAVARWLKIVDDSGAGPGSLELRPRKLAPRGSPGNDRAVGLLEQKLATVADKDYRRAVQMLLVDLYSAQGHAEKARKLMTALAGSGPATTGPTAGNNDRPPPNGQAAAQLKLASLSVQAGRLRDAVGQLQPYLKQFSAADLPKALYLLGEAQLGLARSEKDASAARKLLVEAGLNFMRVAALHPDAPETPAALLGAGEVNERLGNEQAARLAYSLIGARHGKSPVAAEAKKRLERLRAAKTAQ